VIPKADIILWASQVSKKKTFYFAKLWITGLNYITIKPIIGITSIQWKKYITYMYLLINRILSSHLILRPFSIMQLILPTFTSILVFYSIDT
jgi:hypothetical protein